MARPALPVAAIVAAVVVSGSAGYGLGRVGGSPGEPDRPDVTAAPVSVVCGASLGSLRRLRTAVASDPAPTAAGLDAEVVVLSQQRLRLDARGGVGSSGRRALARALDATVVDLARAGGTDPAGGGPGADDVASAVDRSLSRVLRACPAP